MPVLRGNTSGMWFVQRFSWLDKQSEARQKTLVPWARHDIGRENKQIMLGDVDRVSFCESLVAKEAVGTQDGGGGKRKGEREEGGGGRGDAKL